MTMIGNAVSSAAVLVAWHASGVKTLDDVRQKGLIVGATSRTGDTYLLPLAVKNILGLDKMKIILGYPGTREAAIALERGEITGRVWDMEGIKAARPQWLADGSLNIVAQLAPKKMPEVPAQRTAGERLRPERRRPPRARRDLPEHDPGAALHRAAEHSRPTARRRCATRSWRR